MLKKTSLVFLLLLSALFVPSPVQAAGGITVTGSAAVAEFPMSLTFLVSATSSAEIVDVRLHYRVERASFTDVASEVYIEFTPSSAIQARWDWDMRKTGGLPPGTGLEYWWTLKDSANNVLETLPGRMVFDDSRYDWRGLTRDKVTLYWYEGDDTFSGELMAAVADAETRLDKDSGIRLKESIRIYIYADSQDLRGSMIFPQDWTGGVAFTHYRVIAIGIAPNQLAWGRRAIAHEMTHMAVDQITMGPYASLPTWLSEGLAMYSEGDLEPGYASLLEAAAREDRVISPRSLSSPFSAFGEISSLSYAESYSLVKFLIDGYGREKMFDLLGVLRDGVGYDEALSRVYSIDMDGLDRLWRPSLGVAPAAAPVKEQGMSPFLTGAGAGLGAGLLLILALFIEDKTWKKN